MAVLCIAVVSADPFGLYHLLSWWLERCADPDYFVTPSVRYSVI